MYNIIVGGEHLYYDNIEERNVAVFEQLIDADEFMHNYDLQLTDVYVKITDDSSQLYAYRVKERKTKEQKPKSKIGFA